MPGEAQAWWSDLRGVAEASPERARTRKLPAALGAAAAIATSAGLAWWLSMPSTPRPAVLAEVGPKSQAPRPAPRVASPTPDAEQVRRAYEQFKLVYANGGRESLTRFSEDCGRSLRGDARILDFCLAFDLFAGAVQAEVGAGLPGKPEARRMAMVRAALPGIEDPAARIEAVHDLMRTASGAPDASRPRGIAPPPRAVRPRAPTRTPAVRPSPAPTAPVVESGPPPPAPIAQPAPRRPVIEAAPACRQASVSDRLVCETPSLAASERRMQAAYDRVLAAGGDPRRVDAAQARFRRAHERATGPAALSRLYARRIVELEAAAARAERASPYAD